MLSFDSKLDEFEEALKRNFADASRVQFYVVAIDGARTKIDTNFQLDAKSVVASGLATAEEVEQAEDPSSFIIAAALQWIRERARERTPPGEERRYFLRVPAHKSERYLPGCSLIITCSADLDEPPAEDPGGAAPGRPVTLAEARDLAELRALRVLGDIGDKHKILIDRLLEMDRLLERKVMRVLDVNDRMESLFAAREKKLMEEVDATRKSLDRSLDRILDLRVAEVEAREKALPAGGGSSDRLADVADKGIDMVKDIVDRTIAYDKGIAPEIMALMPRLAKNPELLDLMKTEAFGKFVDDPDTAKVLKAYVQPDSTPEPKP